METDAVTSTTSHLTSTFHVNLFSNVSISYLYMFVCVRLTDLTEKETKIQ